MTDRQPAIVCDGVTKDFLLIHNRQDSLKRRAIGLVHKRWRPSKRMFRAVDDVSFEVGRGEALGLMGPNGSGKSTLLSIITGIIPPSAGRVEVHGRAAPMIELGVGFNPELTGEENIYLNASLYGFRNRKIRELVPDIVEFSGLADFIDQPVKNYSSGMYARLGFSVAIHVEPDVLLVDEVMAVGDTEFKQKCFTRIRELRARGMTLLLVSHMESQIIDFCDRYIRMEHGKAVAQGPTSELK